MLLVHCDYIVTNLDKEIFLDLSRIFNETGYDDRLQPQCDCGNYLCSKSSKIKKYQYNNRIEKITLFQSKSDVITIDNHFLSNFSELTHVYIVGSLNVKKIGSHVLAENIKLCEFDTKGLETVENIGCDFLRDATSLTDFNTCGFVNVKKIERHFLQNCTSLTSLNMEHFANVEFIDWGFIHGCTKLNVINVPMLSKKLYIRKYANDHNHRTSIELFTESVQLMFSEMYGFKRQYMFAIKRKFERFKSFESFDYSYYLCH